MAGKKSEQFQKVEFETLMPFAFYDRNRLEQKDPSCFNGVVRIRKYRVTVEEIAEPKEVLAARLQALWDECTNHHEVGPLRQAAKEIGYELQGRNGSKVKGR